MCFYASWPGSNAVTFSRSDSGSSRSRSNSLRYMEHTCLMMEKRQLFLRNQFSQKRSLMDQIGRSFAKVKKVIWFKLQSVAAYRKLVCWFRQRLRSRRRPKLLIIVLGNYMVITDKVEETFVPAYIK